jgi:hypothetical protein
MDDQKTARGLMGQLGATAVKTATVWADANQRLLLELVDFSAATAKEGVKLYAELQLGALEVMRADSVEKAFKLLEGTTQTIARSAERIQTSADQSARSIQETCTAVVARLKDVCAQG